MKPKFESRGRDFLRTVHVESLSKANVYIGHAVIVRSVMYVIVY